MKKKASAAIIAAALIAVSTAGTAIAAALPEPKEPKTSKQALDIAKDLTKPIPHGRYLMSTPNRER